jgi:agmatine/peptidylarginine deiminase
MSMKIENRTPHQDGFYMPGEFEPQDGVILIWPKRPGSWPYEAKEARKVFAEIANKLTGMTTDNSFASAEKCFTASFSFTSFANS